MPWETIVVRVSKLRTWSTVAALLAAGCGTNFSDTANLDSKGTTILCFGDSLTRGYGASPGNDYPSRLGVLIGLPVINAGRDGDTSADALKRLERDVLEHNARIIMIALGGNDLLKQVPRETTEENLGRIVGQCVSGGAMVVLVHAKYGLFLSDPYIETYESVGERYGAVVVRDVLDNVLGNPKHMYDQVHPNDEGYGLMAERVAAVVGPLLKAAEEIRNQP